LAGVGDVTVLSCLLASVLEEALGVAELDVLELELALGVELVLGALEPPAALDESFSVLDFELEVEPLLDWSFLFLRSPLCLPLFVCLRPCASVETFGLSVGPAFVVSGVVAPAPAVVPVEALPLAVLFSLVLPLAVLLSLVLPLTLPLALVSPCTLVLWAAASWLNDTASKPENRTGKNLRIAILRGLGNGLREALLQTPCHGGAYLGGSTG